MHRVLILLVAGLLLLAGCSDSDDGGGDAATSEPSANGLTLSVDPGEAASGGTIRVAIAGPDAAEVSYGTDLLLERSEGGEWIGTHRLVAVEDGGGASPIGQSAAVPAVAYTDRETLGYELPELSAGSYRVSREVSVTGGAGPLAETLTTEFAVG